MQRAILTLFLVMYILNAFSQNKGSDKLIITGDLSKLSSLPVNFVINKLSLGSYEEHSDTCKIVDNRIYYESKLAEPGVLTLTFYWPNRKQTSTRFNAFSSSYEIIVGDDLKPAVKNITKSSLADEFIDLEEQIKYYRLKGDSLVKKVDYEHQSIEKAEKRVIELKDSIEMRIDEDLYGKIAVSHSTSPLGLYALCNYADRPAANPRRKSQPDLIRKMLNQLSPEIQKLPSARMLETQLVLARNLEKGKLLKSISLADTAGRRVSISDFKGKYVLIDFWASWCAYCRLEHPGFIQAYNKYKQKGFQIISVTLDKPTEKRAWMNAIKKDQIGLWPQLMDELNAAQEVYNIRAVPANYLIDGEGIIIAKDLRGIDLEKELMRVFKN